MTRHKEITAHIRKCIKNEGISANVNMSPVRGCANLGGIRIVTKSYDAKFSNDQARMIAHICDCNKLTGVRGDKIDVNLHANLGGNNQFDFYLSSACL